MHKICLFYRFNLDKILYIEIKIGDVIFYFKTILIFAAKS